MKSTEFPGIVSRPIGSFKTTTDYHYQTMRTNADILNLLQLSMVITDSEGLRPEGVSSCWVFNFEFHIENDIFSLGYLEDLIRNNGNNGGVDGIDLGKHATHGIPHFQFAELIWDSGLVLSDDVSWISFHALVFQNHCHVLYILKLTIQFIYLFRGYDFGFLASILLNKPLPSELKPFKWWLNTLFPNLYDVKFMSRLYKPDLKGNLETLIDELGISPNLQLQDLNGLSQWESSIGQAILVGLSWLELRSLWDGKIKEDSYKYV